MSCHMSPDATSIIVSLDVLCHYITVCVAVFSKGQLSGGDGVSYDFNMASLADHLKKQSEQGSSTYYNIDIIKYEVRGGK